MIAKGGTEAEKAALEDQELQGGTPEEKQSEVQDRKRPASETAAGAQDPSGSATTEGITDGTVTPETDPWDTGSRAQPGAGSSAPTGSNVSL